jgi:hypothetical protein
MPDESKPIPIPAPSSADAALERFAAFLGPSSRQHAATFILLALVAGIAYSNTLQAALRDDELELITAILDADAAQAPTGLGGLALGIESRLFGVAPLPYRVASVLWHFAAAFALYSVARRMISCGVYGWFAATLAAVILAAHPAATHAVNDLAARGALMATALALFGALAMLSAAALPESVASRWTRAATSWVVLCVAWAASPAAILAAPILPALEYAARSRITWMLHIPAIVLLALLTLLTGVSQAIIEGAAANAHPVFVVQALKALFTPVNLLVYHAPVSQGGTWPWVALLLLGAVAFAVRPALGAGLLWITLAIRFVPITGAPASFDEAHLHLALAGLAIAVAVLLDLPRVAPLRAVVALPLLLAALGCVALTSTRNNLWRSEAALWLQANQACPNCVVPLDRLGRLYFDQATRDLSTPGATPADPEVRGFLESAVALFAQADALADFSAERVTLRASALRVLDRPGESDALLLLAFNRQPAEGDLLLARAQTTPLSLDAGRDSPRRAVRYFRAADRRTALDPFLQLRYARALAGIGDWYDAAVRLDLAGAGVDADPTVPPLRTEVAARVQAAQTTLALYMQAAARVTPADRAAIQSAALDAHGHYQLAAHVAYDALTRYPEVAGPWRAAGIAEQHMGRLGTFLAHGVPATLPGDPADAWREFAHHLGQVSEWGGVERVHREALGAGEYEACLRTAALARELNRVSIASGYLRRAATLDTANPEPWLQLADLAIDAQLQDVAREAIANAEQRGAPADAVNALKARAGVSATDAQGLRRTIIR